MRRRLLQYVSDLHLNRSSVLPKIKPVAPYLGLCGDIGAYDCEKTNSFLKHVSHSYDKVFFVPGNHEYHCPLFNREKYVKYLPYIEEMCDKHDIHLLNNNYYEKDNFVILGSTLWSNALFPDYELSKSNQQSCIDNMDDHINKHNEDLRWLRGKIGEFKKRNITVMTHYPPTQRLMGKKYYQRGKAYRSWYCNELDEMLDSPVKNWLAGHIHTTNQLYEKNVFVGINATGANAKEISLKSITLL